MADGFPEQIGPFRLYAPSGVAGPQDGFSLSWEGEWLPVVLRDRDAALVLMGLFLDRAEQGPYQWVVDGHRVDLTPVTVERIAEACEAFREGRDG